MILCIARNSFAQFFCKDNGFLGIIQILNLLSSYKHGIFVLGVGNNRVEKGDDS